MKIDTPDLYSLVNVKKNLDSEYLISICKQNSEHLHSLLNIALSKEPLPARNAGYVISLLAENDRQLILPYVKEICTAIPGLKHNSQIYCLIMTLANTKPAIEELESLLDYLFKSMELSKEFTSVKYASISYLDILCEQEPFLINELTETLIYYIPRFEKVYLIKHAQEILAKWKKHVD